MAAPSFRRRDVVDPRPFAVEHHAATMRSYPKNEDHPACNGYGDAQMKDLEETINKSDVDMVIVGTPHRLEEDYQY